MFRWTASGFAFAVCLIEAGVYVNREWRERDLRRFEEAVRCYQQALAICPDTGDRHGEGQALNTLGHAYRKLRRLEEAVGCYQSALVICQETGDRHGEGQALSNLGHAYQELRLSDRAAVFWQGAAAAMRDAGDHDQAARLEQLAPSAQARRHRWRRSG